MTIAITTEENIVKGQPFIIRQEVELQFSGETLSTLQEQNRAMINLTESAASNKGPRKLNVVVEGIHAGMTKNRTFYPGNTLEESVPTWTAPHYKPVLKNHNTYTEPLGRIKKAEFKDSTLKDGKTVQLHLELTDQDAIDKVLDGRYLTLSVGGSANRVNCSVCGKDLVQEGYCGHMRGRTYEGKEAHWIIGNYTGDEISFVNMPADVYSQVIAAELVPGEGGKNVSGKPTEGAGAPDEAGLIDGILAEGANTGNPADPTKQTEGVNPDTPPAGDPNPAAPKEGEGDGNLPGGAKTAEGNQEETLEEKVARLEKELGEATGKVSELTTQLKTAQTETTQVQATVSERDTEIADLKKQLEAADAEKNTFVERNVQLAKFARRQMVERVADLRIASGKSMATEREALVEQYGSVNTKVLETTIADLLTAPRVPAQVPSPGVVEGTVGADGTITEGLGTKESEDKTPKYMSLKDMEDSMIGFMTKNL